MCVCARVRACVCIVYRILLSSIYSYYCNKFFKFKIAQSEASMQVEHPWRNLLERKYRPNLTMAILIPFFQQFSGINVIMFYAPVMFSSIGFKDDASLMSVVITGVVNVVATCVSIYGVDRWGRRALFLEGGAQMMIC